MVSIGGHRVLVDAGIRVQVAAPMTGGGGSPDPRLPRLDGLPQLGPIDAVVLTHAHADHGNALPVALRMLPDDIPVLCTPETAQILAINLIDQVLLAARGVGGPALFTREEVEATLARLQPLTPGRTQMLALRAGRLALKAVHAGHVLGAVMLALEASDGARGFWRVLHTGDFDTEAGLAVAGADVESLRDFRPHLCISEGTYGVTPHADVGTQRLDLLRTVCEVAVRGGTTLIPAFAIGRAQEVGLLFRQYAQDPEAFAPAWTDLAATPPLLDVCLDGGARRVADIYDAARAHLTPAAQALAPPDAHLFFGGRRPLRALRQHERTLQDIRQPGRVLISPSGTLRGGPSETYARLVARHASDAILLVGYADEESPGRRLLKLVDAPASDRVLALGGTDPVPVACHLGSYKLSAHTGVDGIRALLCAIRPFATTLVHGDPQTLAALRDDLVDGADAGGYGRAISLAPLGAPKDERANGRGRPHAVSVLLASSVVVVPPRRDLPAAASPRPTGLILDPLQIWQAALNGGGRAYTVEQLTALAVPDVMPDAGLVRLVADEVEGALHRLWYQHPGRTYGTLYTPLAPTSAERRSPPALPARRTRAATTPCAIGDVVVVRYLGLFARAALVLAVDAEADRLEVVMASSLHTSAALSDIVVHVGAAPEFLALPADQRRDRFSRLAFDGAPMQTQPVDPVAARARLLTFLWQAAFRDGADEGAAHARAAAALLVNVPELVWRGTPAQVTALAGVPETALSAIVQWLTEQSVLVYVEGPELQIRFAPMARRLLLADMPLRERILHEVRAWRHALARDAIESAQVPTGGGRAVSAPPAALAEPLPT